MATMASWSAVPRVVQLVLKINEKVHGRAD